jgi:hypothetical protein
MVTCETENCKQSNLEIFNIRLKIYKQISLSSASFCEIKMIFYQILFCNLEKITKKSAKLFYFENSSSIILKNG